MATLKELYTTLKALRDMNLPVEEKLLKAADKLEEKIIKEEILPSLSENIEPLLNEIQRDLVLVVEYHPNEPIGVALSRKAKISEIVDAKTLTPNVKKDRVNRPVTDDAPAVKLGNHEPSKHIENPTKGLRVAFPDGRVYWYKNAIDTFISTLDSIGLEKVSAVNILHNGYNLVGKVLRKPQAGRVWQHKIKDWYVYSNISNQSKIADLKRISEFYNLNITIEEIKPK